MPQSDDETTEGSFGNSEEADLGTTNVCPRILRPYSDYDDAAYRHE